MKTKKQRIKVEIHNIFKPLVGNAEDVTENTYTLLPLVYTRGTIQRGMGFGGGGRIRNVKSLLHERFIAGIWSSMSKRLSADKKIEMVEKNIVEIPRNGTENVEFELNIPLTVTSGEYTLRVLQIPTDPETLGPILDIPDMDNEKDPSTYTALKAILKQLKAQNQRVITEYFKDFKFENKQIDTHVKETGELLTFFDKRFVQAAEKHPDELIKATVKNPKSMKLNELPTLWEDANQMYRSLSPNAEWQKKRRTAEMAYKVVEEPEERVQAVIKRAGVRVEQHNAQSKDKLIFWADRGHKKINEGILDNPVAIQIFKEEFNEGFFHYMQTVLNFCKEVFIAFKGRSTKPVGQDRFQAKQATQGNPNLDQLRNAG